MIVEIRRLGLAAYIKMVGTPLLKYENRVFYFETERTAEEWEVEYSNSCCSRHDSELCELRKFLTSK